MTECASFNDVPGEFGHAYTNGATWPVNAMLVSELELPSVYIDGSNVWRLDHLTAQADTKGKVTIGNPTQFPAIAQLQWRNGATARIELKPGQSSTISPVSFAKKKK